MMQNPRILLSSFALLCILIGAPALGLTLQSGTYKLEWKIPAADEVCGVDATVSDMSLMDQDSRQRFDGLSSASAYWTDVRGLTVVVDESGGTDTGYDVAYVFRVLAPELRMDLKTALKCRLKDDFGVLRPETNSDLFVHLPVGGPDSKLTRRFAVDLEIRLAPKCGKSAPSSVVATLRGGWYGTIKADDTDLQARTIQSDPGDYVLLGRSVDDPATSLLALADVVSYENKLYVMNISSTGDTLDIQPFAGRTGTLHVDARNGANKPVAPQLVTLSGKPGALSFEGNAEVTAPVGDYTDLKASVVADPSTDAEKRLVITMESAQLSEAIKLTEGKTATVKLGGPIRLDADPGSRIMKIKRGAQKPISLTLALDDGQIQFLDNTPTAVVKIRDSAGAALTCQEFAFDSDGVCKFGVQVPQNWKPGRYKMGIFVNLGAYQQPLVLEKKLRVTR